MHLADTFIQSTMFKLFYPFMHFLGIKTTILALWALCFTTGVSKPGPGWPEFSSKSS